MYARWTEAFSRGYADAIPEAHVMTACDEPFDSIVFVCKVPSSWEDWEVEQYRDGVRYVLGEDVEFAIERGPEL